MGGDLGRVISALESHKLTVVELARREQMRVVTLRDPLREAGVAIRGWGGANKKSREEKMAFAQQRLKTAFGAALPGLIQELATGEATIREASARGGLKPWTLGHLLRTAAALTSDNRGSITIPCARRETISIIAADPPADQVSKRVIILDLVNLADPQATQILHKFNRPDFSAGWAARATDGQLKVKFGLTKEEILYLRQQLRSHGIGH